LKSPHQPKITFIFCFEESLKYFVPIGIKGKTTTFVIFGDDPNFIAEQQCVKT